MKFKYIFILLFLLLCGCSSNSNDEKYNILVDKYKGMIFTFDNHQYIIQSVRKTDDGYFFISTSSVNTIWFSEKELTNILKQ